MWDSLGISNSQVYRDMMEPMSQEFVIEVDENEQKLNKEIESLLDGIDFQQNLSQEKSSRPTCIPSTIPEENALKCIEKENISSSPTCIPSTFPEVDGLKSVQQDNISSTLPEKDVLNCIQQENIDRDEVMSSPLLFSQEKSEDRSSPLLFSQEKLKRKQ